MLIICSECGKQFSDKASACPNCGCPIEHVKVYREEPENFKCEKCGCEKYVIGENEYEKVMLCYDCGEGYLLEKKKERIEVPQVHCPFCNSTDVGRIPAISQTIDIALWGVGALFQEKKQWCCNQCGSTF